MDNRKFRGIGISVSPIMDDQLRQLAKEAGITLSSMCRIMLQEQINRMKPVNKDKVNAILNNRKQQELES